MAPAPTSTTILGPAPPLNRKSGVIVVLSAGWAAPACRPPLPADPQQRGDRRLVDVLGQPGHHVLEVTGVPGPGPGPRDLFGAHPLTASTGDPDDLGFQEAPGRPEGEVAPAAHPAALGGPGPPAARAAVTGRPAAQPHP